MERINQFSFYELGCTLVQLRRYENGAADHGKFYWHLWQASIALSSLKEGNPVPLGVSRAATEELLNHIEWIRDQFFTTDDGHGGKIPFYVNGESRTVSPWSFEQLTKLLAKFEAVFGAEMAEAATYFVPRRGIYFTPALVDAADDAFPAEVRPYIPSKTFEDWKAAGRCLAFNLLSASGFHVARAVEGTLEVYWCQFKGAEPGTTLRSWNDYLKELEGIANAGHPPVPAAKTVAELKQMKDDYRNPIMHPRVILDESDARMLFNNGESSIIAMAEELRDFRAAQGGAQKP